eukprot:Em0003g1658a
MEKRAEDEKDVYDITLNYIARGSYPQDATKQDKCAIRKRAKQYRVQDGQLYRVICSASKNGDALSLYIKDAKTRKQIINGCHIGLAGNHEGRDRTLAKIAQKYFWPGLSKDVRIWVQHSDQCQKTKRKFDHPAEELHPVPVPNSSWKQIGIDLIGPLPTTTNVVDDNIVDEVEELDNSDSECAGACTSYYEAKEDDEEFDNAELDLQQEEYALSKDIDVSLWIDFREFYGNFPLQDVLDGNFVAVNENLHAEFAEFKGKVLSYIGTTHCLVKGIELLKVWSRSTKAQLKPVHVLGNIYFLMSPYDLDELSVTGSQEFHEELRLLITTYMIHKSTDPMLSSLGSPDGSVESYMKRSRMQTLGT